jgi:hypothetical protein
MREIGQMVFDRGLECSTMPTEQSMKGIGSRT